MVFVLYFRYVKKRHIVEAGLFYERCACLSFPAAQFDSAGRPLLAREEPRHHTLTRHPQHPPAPLPLQYHAKQKSWTQKILRSTPALSSPSPTPASCSPDTESCPVDPAVPLEKQRWLFFSILDGCLHPWFPVVAYLYGLYNRRRQCVCVVDYSLRHLSLWITSHNNCKIINVD